MVITKRSLSRRRMLRGMGAALALPLLDAMIPALTATVKTAGVPTPRFAGVFKPMGVRQGAWTPATTGHGFEFTPILRPLEPFKEHVTVVTELFCRYGNHNDAGAGWMSGSVPRQTNAQEVYCGTTLDQAIAQKIGRDSPLLSLEVAGEEITAYSACGNSSCVYANTISWRTPETPLPMEVNPRNVFERLFGSGTREQRQVRLREDRSVLDSIERDDLTGLTRQLGPRDRARLEDYLTYLREVEQRVQRLEAVAATDLNLPEPPTGIPEVWADNVRMMYDFLVLAWQADITRVASVMTAHETSKLVFDNFGHTEAWHPLTHNGRNQEKLSQTQQINEFELTLFAEFLKKLKNTPDGDGSLLDHSLILFGSGMGEPDQHSPIDVPTLVVGGHGGRLRGWRHIKTEPTTPLANLLAGIANQFDLGLERYGALSTGVVEL